MKSSPVIGSGFAGALALTVVHEALRKIDPKAPRLDLLGMSALSKLLKNLGKKNSSERSLYLWSMAGDMLSNSLFYSLAGVGKNKGSLVRGTVLGLAAGMGSILLPKKLGMNSNAYNGSTKAKIFTLGLYMVGGLVAAGVLRLLHKESKQ